MDHYSQLSTNCFLLYPHLINLTGFQMKISIPMCYHCSVSMVDIDFCQDGCFNEKGILMHVSNSFQLQNHMSTLSVSSLLCDSAPTH